MEIRFQNSPGETHQMDTQQLRTNFLVSKSISLPNEAELKAANFLERRELGIINVGGRGSVTTNGKTYETEKLEPVFLGKGNKAVSFSRHSKKDPAVFYLLSAPAHHSYPNKKMTRKQAAPIQHGDITTSSKQTIYKYIHNDGIQSYIVMANLAAVISPPHKEFSDMDPAPVPTLQ